MAVIVDAVVALVAQHFLTHSDRIVGLVDLGNCSTRPVAFREGRKVFPDRHGPAISSCAIDDLCFCIPQSFQREPVRYHGGVLLDGVGDALILKKNREALQGRAKQAEGAQSATMMYSYKYTLARRAVIATFDLSASHLEALSSDRWLQNPLSVVQLHLRGRVVSDA